MANRKGKVNISINAKDAIKKGEEVKHAIAIINFESKIKFLSEEQLSDYIKSLKEEVQRRIKLEQ